MKQVSVEGAELPHYIQRVMRVIDDLGEATGEIAIIFKGKGESGKNELRSTYMTVEALSGDVGAKAIVVQTFKHAGEACDVKNARAICREIIRRATEPVKVVRVSGLHSFDENGVLHRGLVWRRHIHWIGKKSPAEVLIAPEVAHAPRAAGTPEQWDDAIGKHIGPNPYLLVVVGAALTAALSPALNLPTTVLGIVGTSSQGKTTMQEVARSLFDSADREIPSATGTPKGFQALLAENRNCPSFLQDLHLADKPGALLDLVFATGNGASRITSSIDQQSRVAASVSTMLIGSSERGLVDLGRGKAVVDEGIAARYFELVIAGPHGAFHKLPKAMDAAEFAMSLKAAAKTFYGTVWDRWIRLISSEFTVIERLYNEKIGRYRARLESKCNAANPVTARLIQGVAVWKFAAHLAAQRGVLPISHDQVNEAFDLVLTEYGSRVTKKGPSIMHGEMVAVVRKYLDQNGNKFPSISEYSLTGHGGIKGYFKTINGEKTFLILPGALKDIVGKDFGLEQVVAALDAAGLLVKKKGGSQYQARLPDSRERKRFYAVRAAICADGE